MKTKLKTKRNILVSALVVLFIVSIIPVLAEEEVELTATVTSDKAKVDLTATVLGPPVADAGGPYYGRPGRAIVFDGMGSYDPDGDGEIESYVWDFGDDGTGTGPTPSHTYSSTGTFTVKLTVTDINGLTDSDETTATVRTPTYPPVNKEPHAKAGPNQKAWMGGTVYFDGSKSKDPDGTIISHIWDFGDDTATASGVEVQHIYSTPGDYEVILTVMDNRMAKDSDTCKVKVFKPPTGVDVEFSQVIPGLTRRHLVDASAVVGTTILLNTTDQVTVTILKFDDNPHPGDPIPATAVPLYVDVMVSDSDAVEWPIYVEMHYTDEEIEGLEESSLGIYYWFNGTWQRCSDTGVDTERNIVWAYMTAEEASGSPILIAGMHAIPTPPLPPILDNLNITPAQLELGDNVTISLDIINIDSQSITYAVDIHIENVNDPPPTWPPMDVYLRIWVELEAYESKTVSHTMTMDAIGDFNVTVHGMTGSFKVGTWPPEPPLTPAEFVVSNLTITPETAELWGDIDDWTFKITVDIKNIGEQEGTHTVDLKVDGDVIQAGTVILWGGEETIIVFDVTRGVGVYTVEVDGLTGSFTVTAYPKPAEFLFSGLKVTPMEVEEGLKVTVTVDISNVGELEGDRIVELKVDGYVVDSEEVILEGGESVMVLFDLTRDAGTYKVDVENLTGSFTVKPKPTVTIWMQPGYVAGILIAIVATGATVYFIWKRKLFPTISPDST